MCPPKGGLYPTRIVPLFHGHYTSLVSVAKREMPRHIRAYRAFLLQIVSLCFGFFLDMYVSTVTYIQSAIEVRISG